MPKLELTKKEMEAVFWLVENHFSPEGHDVGQVDLNSVNREKHLVLVAVKLGVLAPDEIEENRRG
mgnify:CR=1 FL=1